MLLVSVVGMVYGVIPAGGKVWEMWGARSQLTADIRALRAKSSVLAGLDEETLRGHLATLASAVPPTKAIPSILSTVDGLAGSTGVTISTLTIANPGPLSTASAQKQTAEEKRLGSSIVTVSMTLDGAPSQIRNFFVQAVAVRRLLRVRVFDMTYLAEQSAEVHATLDAFYASIPTSLGDIASTIAPLTTTEEVTLTKLSAYPLYTRAEENVSVTPVLSPIRGDPFSL